MKKHSFSYQIRSFRWAWSGLSEFFKEEEVKPKIHATAAIVAIIAGIVLKIRTPEWLFIILAIGIVFITEIINTSIERLATLLPDEHDALRGRIKDIGAAAVLFSSVVAALIGCIIFIPKIISLWATHF